MTKDPVTSLASVRNVSGALSDRASELRKGTKKDVSVSAFMSA
jgi:hypothetical protein